MGDKYLGLGSTDALSIQGKQVNTNNLADGNVLMYCSATDELIYNSSDSGDAISIQGISVNSTAPTDTHVLTYNSAYDEWVAKEGGGGGGLTKWTESANGDLTHDGDFQISINIAPNAVNDATIAPNLYIAAADKSAGTGKGGNLFLAPGESTGGTRGDIYISGNLYPTTTGIYNLGRAANSYEWKDLSLQGILYMYGNSNAYVWDNGSFKILDSYASQGWMINKSGGNIANFNSVQLLMYKDITPCNSGQMHLSKHSDAPWAGIHTRRDVITANTVNLTADDQVVVTNATSFIILTSDSAAAADRTFTLAAGIEAGHELTLLWNESDATGAGTLNVSATTRLSDDWQPNISDTLRLIFDGTNWCEVSRSNN